MSLVGWSTRYWTLLKVLNQWSLTSEYSIPYTDNKYYIHLYSHWLNPSPTKTLFFIAFGRWAREMDGRFGSVACSLWSSCTIQMHLSMVPTGPPQQGKRGFKDSGAFSASSSSMTFFAASVAASVKPALASPIAPLISFIMAGTARNCTLATTVAPGNLSRKTAVSSSVALLRHEGCIPLFPYHDILIGPPTSWLILICRYCGSE